MVDLRRTLTLAYRWRRRPIARRGRGGGALGSRVSPGPLGVPFRRARESVGLARRRPGDAPKRRAFVLTKRSTSFATAIFPPGVRRASSGRGGGFSSALNAWTRRGTAKNFRKRCDTLWDRRRASAPCSSKSMVTQDQKDASVPLALVLTSEPTNVKAPQKSSSSTSVQRAAAIDRAIARPRPRGTSRRRRLPGTVPGRETRQLPAPTLA